LSRVSACRNKRIPLEGSLNGVDDRKGVLSDVGDVAPDAAENIKFRGGSHIVFR